jgi:hypothetical protein
MRFPTPSSISGGRKNKAAASTRFTHKSSDRSCISVSSCLRCLPCPPSASLSSSLSPLLPYPLAPSPLPLCCSVPPPRPPRPLPASSPPFTPNISRRGSTARSTRRPRKVCHRLHARP